jgi:PKD repeat protein
MYNTIYCFGDDRTMLKNKKNRLKLCTIVFLCILAVSFFNSKTAWANSTNLPPVAVLPSATIIIDEGTTTTVTINGNNSYDPEGNPLYYRWDIGAKGVWTVWSTHSTITLSGITSNTTIPIKLKVSDGLLENSTTATFTINIHNFPPTVNAGEDVEVYVGCPVHFNGTCSDVGNDIYSVEWNFGDGNITGWTLAPVHVYSVIGNYTVTLTVTDLAGASTTDQLTVHVVPVLFPIYLCNSAGAIQTKFDDAEVVCLRGVSFPPDAAMPVYVVNHITVWTDGLNLSDMQWQSGTIVHTDAEGTLAPTMIWEPALRVGCYDVFIDINSNSIYDQGTDVTLSLQLNDQPPGLIVTPEGPFGALLTLLACIAAYFVVLKRKQPN